MTISVYSQHGVLYLTNVNVNTPLTPFYGLCNVIVAEKASTAIYKFDISHTCTDDLNSTAISDGKCRFFMPPTLKKWGTYWFRLVRMYVCVCVCMYSFRDIVLKLHVWIPHGKIADAYFWFSLDYLPLLNYGPSTNKGMKFCNAVS